MGEFDLLLFHRDFETSQTYLKAGVDGIIVDLETAGKAKRQLGFDTEINDHTIADLHALRANSDGYLLCRLSGADVTETEVSQVIQAGANEIIVPMLNSMFQAERICRLAENICKVTLMVETVEAMGIAEKLSKLPVARIYVGLNDLRIARQTASIFSPLADGTLERLRAAIKGPAFGFGGLTLPSKGAPLPAFHLYNEMARLDANFTFLRRSFYRDVDQLAPETALSNIKSHYAAARMRPSAQINENHSAMIAALSDLKMVGADA